MNSRKALLDAFDTSPSTSLKSRTHESTIRPRNRRLISITDEGGSDGDDISSFSPGGTPLQSRGTTPSPYTSARASPLPSTHPSRTTGDSLRNGNSSDRYFTADGAVEDPYGGGSSGGSFAGGVFESSWSSLQGLAASVFGDSSNTQAVPKSGLTLPYRRRKSRESDFVAPYSIASSSSTWGPSVQTSSRIGAGTKEDRQALVQAKRREKLLLVNGDSVSALKRRYKRRDSMESSNSAAIDPELDEEALVYVHRVQPIDNITGVTLRYGCHLDTMRKANGFWPSDSIQMRKVVLLPVEACSVKGRRLPDKSDRDLLEGEPPKRDSTEDPNGSTIVPAHLPLIQKAYNSEQDDVHGDTKTDAEKTWKHEAWVEIEGFPAAVEIGRIPRRTLGFFPRSRRKSLTIPYSDADTSTEQPFFSDRAQGEAWPTLATHRPTSPSEISCVPLQAGRNSFNSLPPRYDGHHRQGSNIFLFGPGGVGTLDKNVFAPGPAPDGLNEFFAQHLPALTATAPPAAASLPTLAQRKMSFESTSTVVSTASSTGLENIGGAIEGWMRKMATRAKAGLIDLQQGGPGFQAHRQSGNIGITGIGDLIELNDASEGMAPPLSTVGARNYIQANASTAQQRSSNVRGDVSNLRERVAPPTSAPRSRIYDRFKDD